LVSNSSQRQTEPLTGRDLIALLATIGVDLGLLALSALNPPPAEPGRRDGLAGSQARLRLPTAAVIRQLSSAFETAIARAPDVDLDWVRRHFIHHGACSYFVIPNLYGVEASDERERLRALAINQLAGVLADLNLVRPLTPSELRRFAKDEVKTNHGDLDALEARHARGKVAAASGYKERVLAMFQTDESAQLRNHGILSKARRALDIAGWSFPAQRDAEVYRLVDCEGLTPLLALFNEATLAKGAAAIEDVRKELELQSELPLRIEGPSGRA
jgi:hypothetical protein